MTLKQTTYSSRDEWLAARRGGLGASDMAVIMGVSPWQSAYGLWAEKTGAIELSADQIEAMEWGLALEDDILDAYSRRTGRVSWCELPWTISVHPEHDWMRSTFDGWRWDDEDQTLAIPIQIKTAGVFKKKEWEDDIPLMYQVQCQSEMAVSGAAYETLAVLFGGQKLWWTDIPRNDAFIDVMIEQGRLFWDRVVNNDPPPVDGSRATAEALAMLYPKDDKQAIPLDGAMAQWVEQLVEARATAKAAGERELEAKNHLAEALGKAAIGALPDGRLVTYGTTEKKGFVVQPTSFRVMRVQQPKR